MSKKKEHAPKVEVDPDDEPWPAESEAEDEALEDAGLIKKPAVPQPSLPLPPPPALPDPGRKYAGPYPNEAEIKQREYDLRHPPK